MPKSSAKARRATIVAIFVEPRSGHREDDFLISKSGHMSALFSMEKSISKY